MSFPFGRDIFFTLFFLGAFSAYGQMFDSIAVSFQHRPGIDFKVETRNSFFINQWAKISSIKLGLNYNHNFNIGLGYNWIRVSVDSKVEVYNSQSELVTLPARFKFHYGTLYADYLFYNKRPWELTITAMVGAGASWNEYTDAYGIKGMTNPRFVFVYEPYMTGVVRFLRYFGVGAGVGFRLALSADKFSRQKLNTLIYIFKAKLYLNDIYKDITKHKKAK